MKLSRMICLTLLSFLFNFAAYDIAYSSDIATILMRSTYKIQQGNIVGTVFILGEPIENQEGRAAFVLFTAKHVLSGMKNSKAILWVRISKEDGSIRKVPFEVDIRDSDGPKWTEHPDVDLVAMRIRLPKSVDIELIPTDFISSDDFIKKYEICPGDDLMVLGYPLGTESNDEGFPVLRSGRIASYPLIPTQKHKTFLLDFEIFPGNSGGPVFIKSRNRAYGGSTHIGVVSQVMGIVSQEKIVPQQIESLDEITIKKHKLSLAVVVHASFMKELLTMLPAYVESN